MGDDTTLSDKLLIIANDIVKRSDAMTAHRCRHDVETAITYWGNIWSDMPEHSRKGLTKVVDNYKLGESDPVATNDKLHLYLGTPEPRRDF